MFKTFHRAMINGGDGVDVADLDSDDMRNIAKTMANIAHNCPNIVYNRLKQTH